MGEQDKISRPNGTLNIFENAINCPFADKISYSIEIVAGSTLDLDADLNKGKITALYNDYLFDTVTLKKSEIRSICKTLNSIDFSIFKSDDYHGKGGVWHHLQISKADLVLVNSKVWQSYQINEHRILWKKLFDIFTKKLKDNDKKEAIKIYRNMR